MACLAVTKSFLAVCSRSKAIVTTLSGKLCLKYEVLVKDVDEKADTNGAFNANNGKNSLYIVDCKFSPSGNYFAICTSSKMLLVWDTSSWSLEFNRQIPRKPMKLVFSKIEDAPLIADKAGDVHRIYLKDEKVEHLIGHLSVILDMVLTSDDTRIITTDRDGKIRMSHFPNCYNIDKFFMAHGSFVSSVALDASEKYLLSIDGDGNLFLWNKVLGSHCDIINLPNEDGSVPRRICVDDERRVFIILDGIKKILHYHIKDEKLEKQEDIILAHVPLDIRCNGKNLWVLQHSKSEPVLSYHFGLESKFSEMKISCFNEIKEFLDEPIKLEPWKCQSWSDDVCKKVNLASGC